MSEPPITFIAMGTTATINSKTVVKLKIIALDNGNVFHVTGTNIIQVKIQPTPKGNGKYSVKNEFGTVLEKRNGSGNARIAITNQIPLLITNSPDIQDNTLTHTLELERKPLVFKTPNEVLEIAKLF